MNFLRNLLAAILGCLMAFGIIMFMFLVFVSLANMDNTVSVSRNSVLEIQLQFPLSDYTGNDRSDPFAGLFEQTLGLDEILHAIAVAKEDGDIKGISINSNFMMAGLAQTQALRKALEDFKSTGKFVYAYGDFYFQKDYYLASVADRIVLNPLGSMEFKGLSAEVLYLKELQEKSGIRMEVVRHGKYKSAVEPFLADEMSPDNREQIRELISSLWESMLTEISASRQLSQDSLNHIANSPGSRRAEFALESGLVDEILYYDQYDLLLKEATGTGSAEEQAFVSLEDYMEVARGKQLLTGKDKVAVVFAQGEILYGEGGPDMIGQGIMMEALAEAREDEDIKAVVLRVNSPGGSALTSEIIWREIELTKALKPVVVSMGNVAASGGYYIAVGADKIFAEPTTVTGSIGVFGTIPNISGLAGKIGINAEQVGTHPNALDYSFFEPMSEEFRSVLQDDIEHTYQTFLKRVSEGRKMSLAGADSLAQGRVWSGTDALRVGLVDELGGLQDAVAEAASQAGLETYGLQKYPKYKSGFSRLLEDLGASGAGRESLLKAEMGEELYGLFRELKQAVHQKGIQARMPFTLQIK